jgi:Coenzyme PQQ synthesis protein D (PqqD)
VRATRLRRVPHMLWRSVGAEVIIADPARTDFELLSGSGGTVWRALSEPRTLRELVDDLAEEHGVEPLTIEDDIHQLVGRLSARGLVEEDLGDA